MAERKLSIKRLILFVFMPLVLLIGAAVGVMTSGLLKGDKPDEPPPPPKIDLTKLPGGYVDVPDLIINMRGAVGSARLLIMQVTMHLELADSRPLVQAELPKVAERPDPVPPEAGSRHALHGGVRRGPPQADGEAGIRCGQAAEADRPHHRPDADPLT
ncbi:MAG: hypothetical protein FJX53_08135 [Alphaproteobacteria bacterium]|nr:hypothetical protein [Alphaproteobacteria bacterium]